MNHTESESAPETGLFPLESGGVQTLQQILARLLSRPSKGRRPFFIFLVALLVVSSGAATASAQETTSAPAQFGIAEEIADAHEEAADQIAEANQQTAESMASVAEAISEMHTNIMESVFGGGGVFGAPFGGDDSGDDDSSDQQDVIDELQNEVESLQEEISSMREELNALRGSDNENEDANDGNESDETNVTDPVAPGDGTNNTTIPDDGDENVTIPDEGNNTTLPDEGNNTTVPDDGADENVTVPDEGNNTTLPDDGANENITEPGDENNTSDEDDTMSDLPKRIVISGEPTENPSSYGFTVSGEVDKAPEHEDEVTDMIRGHNVTGVIEPGGIDIYHFSGNITNVTENGNMTITAGSADGSQMEPIEERDDVKDTAPGEENSTNETAPDDGVDEENSTNESAPDEIVTNSSFEILHTSTENPSQYKNVIFTNSTDNETVVQVEGQIIGSNGCATADLAEYTYNTSADTLTITVAENNTDVEHVVCTQALIGIDYMAEFTVSEYPGTVEVYHDRGDTQTLVGTAAYNGSAP